MKDAAKELDEGEAALIFVGEPTLYKAFEQAITRANKVAKQEFDSTADALADELRNAGES